MTEKHCPTCACEAPRIVPATAAVAWADIKIDWTQAAAAAPMPTTIVTYLWTENAPPIIERKPL